MGRRPYTVDVSSITAVREDGLLKQVNQVFLSIIFY